jgi:hypothetical protein
MGLHRFRARAARYTLGLHDQRVMRFSQHSDDGKNAIQNTQLVDLSQSGAAFVVDSPFEPNLGDRIMVEIPIPGGEQIAWWAEVVRLQEVRPRRRFSASDDFMADRKVLVGLRFEPLPEAHSRTLKRGLEDSFLRVMREQHTRNVQYYKTKLRHSARLIFLFGLAVLGFWFVYWLAQPDANYDAKRGAPWGERIKFFSK